jgi:hypothetical protein
MPALSDDVTFTAAAMAGDIMNLLVLDDLWTAAVTATRPEQRDASPSGFAQTIARRMIPLLEQVGTGYPFIRELPDVIGDDGIERFNALQWGNELNAEDRDDLRWLVVREGGFQGLANSAADALSEYAREIESLEEQLSSMGQGLEVDGDLSRRFRCGLGKNLIVAAAATLPATATAGAGAAFAAGAVAAGVAVGATGGIAAIAVIVAGLIVIRKARC